MITIAEAFKLLQIEDRECIFLIPFGKHRAFSKVMTGAEIRKKLDMKAVKVHHIRTSVSSYDGEFFGWEFDVSGCRINE